ncbi:peptidase of plants and bacteria-domain-containing protein [Fimicolochytrium jonesii]|uniref:peptidase of plants and bacteria-domain-containing protein n=1 Tax=Fimicolochytrium jonesii TaxID=1396493 RepID=UPI0022FDF366|nr:peptidase of plants and bacteria-domain-containing protein [Fimicolochytrium jonesii]KAI8826646.1 peptidase of plants and bacteria-domain-containing protein [Fimicolochytrium jonesii]
MTSPTSHHPSAPTPTPTPTVLPLPIRLPPVTVHLTHHPGTTLFSKSIPIPTDLLLTLSLRAIALIYPAASSTTLPPLASISLHVRPFEGIAHTTHSHTTCTDTPPPSDAIPPSGTITSEIHLSSTYIQSVHATNASDVKATTHEILGVLLHELTHVWQCYVAAPAPHWIVEGVADYVRLRGGLAARHWRRGVGGNWADGYERSGYFLDWCEGKWEGLVGELTRRPAEETVRGWTGVEVGVLWERYQAWLEEEGGEAAGVSVPTHGVEVPMPTHEPA